MPTIEKHIVREVVALDASTSCQDAAHLMEARRIGSVGVRRDGKLVGLVTERDLVYEVMARGGDTAKSLGEVMRNDRRSRVPQTRHPRTPRSPTPAGAGCGSVPPRRRRRPVSPAWLARSTKTTPSVTGVSVRPHAAQNPAATAKNA